MLIIDIAHSVNDDDVDESSTSSRKSALIPKLNLVFQNLTSLQKNKFSNDHI